MEEVGVEEVDDGGDFYVGVVLVGVVVVGFVGGDFEGVAFKSDDERAVVPVGCGEGVMEEHPVLVGGVLFELFGEGFEDETHRVPGGV